MQCDDTCSIEGCIVCLGNTDSCLTCSGEYFLDLDSLQCQPTCPSEAIPIEFDDSEFKVCRSTKFYINSESEESIELGTYDYPYKDLVWPFREVYNYHFTHQNYEILIAEKSDNYLYTAHQPIVIASVE